MMNSFIAEVSDKKEPISTFVIEYLFIIFYLPHNNYKDKKSRKKKRWPGDLTETIGAYERLGLLEIQARAV